MLYNSLKLIHILSAAGVLTTIGYCTHCWYKQTLSPSAGWIMVPFALLQLISGFTMISLKNYSFKLIWIEASVVSFFMMMIGWFGFIYFLLSPKTRLLQFFLLSISILSMLSMVFFMANKT